MNKRAFLIGLSVMVLNATGCAFAMHNKAFRAVQVCTGGYLIGKGLEKGYKQYNETLKPVSGVSAKPAIEKLVKDRLKYHNISQADEMAVMVSVAESHGFWATNDKAIYVAPLIEMKLETSLAGTAEERRSFNKYRQKIADTRASELYRQCNTKLQDSHCSKWESALSEWEDGLNKRENDLNEQDAFAEKFIAQQLGILNHETYHIKTGINSRLYPLALMPIAVQGMSSTLSYGVNKVLKRKSPTSWKSAIARSGLAIGSVPLKLLLTGSGVVLHARNDEKNADQFACENAKDKKELEGFRDFFKDELHVESFEKAQHNMYPDLSSYSKENQRRLLRLLYVPLSPIHPYPGDRVDMFQKYIDRWDEDHSKDADN